MTGRVERDGRYDRTLALLLRGRSMESFAPFSLLRSPAQPRPPFRHAGSRVLSFLLQVTFFSSVIARVDLRCLGIVSSYREVPF